MSLLLSRRFYEQLEVVNRGVNMIVDDAAEIPATISTQGAFEASLPSKRGKVEELLNRIRILFKMLVALKET